MAHDIFISHSTKDKQIADAVCHYLEQNGIRCWIAPRDILPGGDWAETIVQAVGESCVMLLIFSANANHSNQINREVNLAAEENIPIVPFRVEDVPPSKKLRYYLGTPHWLDALTPPIENHLSKLAKSLSVLLSATSNKRAALGDMETLSDVKNEFENTQNNAYSESLSSQTEPIEQPNIDNLPIKHQEKIQNDLISEPASSESITNAPKPKSFIFQFSLAIKSSFLNNKGLWLAGGGVFIALIISFVMLMNKSQVVETPFIEPTKTSQNIFEERRRTAEHTPEQYISLHSTNPQNAEDFFLLGRAYLLTENYSNARTVFLQSRNLLLETVESRRKILDDEITLNLEIIKNCQRINTGKNDEGRKCAILVLDSLKESFSPNTLVKALNFYPFSFAAGKHEITPDYESFLRTAAEKFKQLPVNTIIEIGGHAEDNYSIQISEKRAESVRNALISFGVDANMLRAHGYGGIKPKANNDTEDGRFQNRRVEFTVISR